MKRVVIETPFAASTEEESKRNAAYLKAAMRDSISKGEAPYASHALYTQFLDDTIPEERAEGIVMGFVWGDLATETVVYVDLGISKGMRAGIDYAQSKGRPVVYREVPGWYEGQERPSPLR